MHITILSQKVRWLGGKGFGVQRSILTNEMGCDQWW